jgi:hypothetical protein
MKQFDLSKQSKAKQGDDSLQKVQDVFQDALSRVGINLEGEGEARKVIAAQFARVLDNRYSILENVVLPDLAQPIPMVMVGPMGVLAINARPDTGVFRAKDDIWAVMDRRTQQYQPGKENLLLLSQEYASAVESFLQAKEAPISEVQPLLIFSDPGAHVESSRPIVRIIPIDALDRYIATLIQTQQVLDAVQVQAIIDLFMEAAKPPEPEKKAPESKPAKTPPPLSGQINLPPALAKFSLTKQQWIFIAVMTGLEFLILIVLIFFILLTV